MSAESVNGRELKALADNYVNSALRIYESGSFVVFQRAGKFYGGISQILDSYEDNILIRVIKIQQPLPGNLIEPLVERARPSKVLDVDENISLENRGLFYARLRDSKLMHLNYREQAHLIKKEIF